MDSKSGGRQSHADVHTAVRSISSYISIGSDGEDIATNDYSGILSGGLRRHGSIAVTIEGISNSQLTSVHSLTASHGQRERSGNASPVGDNFLGSDGSHNDLISSHIVIYLQRSTALGGIGHVELVSSSTSQSSASELHILLVSVVLGALGNLAVVGHIATASGNVGVGAIGIAVVGSSLNIGTLRNHLALAIHRDLHHTIQSSNLSGHGQAARSGEGPAFLSAVGDVGVTITSYFSKALLNLFITNVRTC